MYLLQPARRQPPQPTLPRTRHRSPSTSSFLRRHTACTHHLTQQQLLQHSGHTAPTCCPAVQHQQKASPSRQPPSTRMVAHAEPAGGRDYRERLKAGGPLYSPTSPQAWDVMRQALAEAGVRARCGTPVMALPLACMLDAVRCRCMLATSRLGLNNKADSCCSCLSLAAGEDGESTGARLCHGARHRHNSGCAA